ncbi:synaptotagmin-like protein 2 isoform X2 [Rhincodon typus]|uniref:synaptotagmin-like protein 2 isoform X2 n=1 Tax=Rhincodon typus TaxID=259920 RepID=UPI00202F0AE3|nr:synaptotagmin-like protein 2 isoform X2 [Rhincodon typus]XP_048454297.1 synaptotagmin-like protein 2 isoform X2 [Rhincodon typus]
MIDLSHLTEEEQAAIMRVLQRDAELRKVEEKRVRHLQESVENEVQRRNMTGEWFYKAKAKRHTDTLHGAELIKASMRKKKPMTIYERLQSKELKENSKIFMNNIEKSVYVSPELSVFLEKPKLEDPHTSPSLHKNNRAPKQQPTPKQSTPSGKQRENPFNRSFLADDIPNGEEKSRRLAGAESVSVTPITEKLSQPKDNVSRLHTSSNEFLETKKPSFAEDGIYSERHPVPKPRTISYKLQDRTAYGGQHHAAPGLVNRNGFNGNSTTPKKSILKHSPSSSSNDSEILLVSVQDSKSKIAASPQTIPEGPAKINAVVDNEELLAPNSLERLKQVRFSTNVDEKNISPTPESYNENRSSKIGEGSLLDTDYFEEAVEGNANGMDNASEDESPHDASGFSDWSHLSSPLSKDPLNVDQDDNVMSNSDFQSIPATSSHITNYTNNHLASSGSSKLNNRVREMDTGEVLTENEVGRRLNSASNLAYHSVDKRIPPPESPQVSNQQPTKIFQGEEEEGSNLALKRNSRTSETYKSLQDINVISSMPSTLDTTSKEMVLSADNVSNIPTTPENTSLQSKRMKRLSKSVPAFPENDDADSMLENSFQMDKHGTIASSLTNISGSSGMASRSSVSGSTMSIYSSDIGNVDVQGKMQFSLDYVDKLKEFHIFVVCCSGLAAAEKKKNRSDPYVKSYLLPDKIKTGKRKTSVKKKNLNPVYNEILRYKIEKASLMAQTLNLSVWHNDTFGRNSFLGEVEIELKNWDWSNKKMDWHDLKPRTISVDRTGDRGSLKVAFRYIPHGYKGRKTGEVQIWVKEASNLPQIRPSRLDPFVKCFILPDTSRKSRQKTRVVKNSRNPVFNHTMVYDGFSTEDLKDACVELSVWDHDKLINHFLGGLRIGLGTGKSYGLTVDWMDSTEEEISVWDKMMTHPNTWVEDLLPLRMLMLSKMSGT